jgi:hypothetical protein
MAGSAAFGLYRGVLEDKWPPLLDVAVHAHFPVRFFQHDLVLSSMWIVTIRAGHQSLGYSMMRWQRKLAFNHLVAGITELGLRLAEQTAV